MSLAGERPERTVSAAALKTDRYLNRTHALFGAEEQRFLEHGLSGKLTVELFFVDGHLQEPGIVTSRVTCKA